MIIVYLATITAFYLLVGLLLMAGALTVLPAVVAVLATPTTAWIQLGLGVGLFALSFWIDPKAVRKRAAKAGPSDVRRRPAGSNGSIGPPPRPAGMITLALSAGLAEVATMLPYLAAIAIIGSFGLSALGSGLTLAGYTLVMVLPAWCLVDRSPRRRPSGQRRAGSVGRLAGPAHREQRLLDRRRSSACCWRGTRWPPEAFGVLPWSA